MLLNEGTENLYLVNICWEVIAYKIVVIKTFYTYVINYSSDLFFSGQNPTESESSTRHQPAFLLQRHLRSV